MGGLTVSVVDRDDPSSGKPGYVGWCRLNAARCAGRPELRQFSFDAARVVAAATEELGNRQRS
jgi:hypothetical protein